MSFFDRFFGKSKPTEMPEEAPGPAVKKKLTYDEQTTAMLARVADAAGLNRSSQMREMEPLSSSESVGGAVAAEEAQQEERDRVQADALSAKIRGQVVPSEPTKGRGIEYYAELERSRQSLYAELAAKEELRTKIHSVELLLQEFQTVWESSYVNGHGTLGLEVQQKLEEVAAGLASFDRHGRSTKTIKGILTQASETGKLSDLVQGYARMEHVCEVSIEALKERLGTTQAEWDEFESRAYWSQTNGGMNPELARKTAAEMETLTGIIPRKA